MLTTLVIVAVTKKFKNRPNFDEFTGMEGEISTDCEETASETNLWTTISNFFKCP